MIINIEITKEQEWVLTDEFHWFHEPYGHGIHHIDYVNNPKSYLNNEQIDKFIELRNELCAMGILSFVIIGGSQYYKLTKIGWMFFNKINSKSV